MSLTESIVEDAALEWFLLRQGFGGQVGELVPPTREVGHGPHLAPGEPAAEWELSRWGIVVKLRSIA